MCVCVRVRVCLCVCVCVCVLDRDTETQREREREREMACQMIVKKMLSSVSAHMFVLRKAHLRSTLSLGNSPVFFFETAIVFAGLTDIGHASYLDGRSSNVAPLYTSLLQTVDRLTFLAMCPQGVSRAPQHLASSETDANYF